MGRADCPGIVTVFAGVGTFATATLICMVASSSWLTDYYCGFLPVIAGYAPQRPISSSRPEQIPLSDTVPAD